MSESTIRAGEVIRIGHRRALVTRVEPFRLYFRYKTAAGWSQTERNIYHDDTAERESSRGGKEV